MFHSTGKHRFPITAALGLAVASTVATACSSSPLTPTPDSALQADPAALPTMLFKKPAADIGSRLVVRESANHQPNANLVDIVVGVEGYHDLGLTVTEDGDNYTIKLADRDFASEFRVVDRLVSSYVHGPSGGHVLLNRKPSDQPESANESILIPTATGLALRDQWNSYTGAPIITAVLQKLSDKNAHIAALSERFLGDQAYIYASASDVETLVGLVTDAAQSTDEPPRHADTSSSSSGSSSGGGSSSSSSGGGPCIPGPSPDGECNGASFSVDLVFLKATGSGATETIQNTWVQGVTPSPKYTCTAPAADYCGGQAPPGTPYLCGCKGPTEPLSYQAGSGWAELTATPAATGTTCAQSGDSALGTGPNITVKVGNTTQTITGCSAKEKGAFTEELGVSVGGSVWYCPAFATCKDTYIKFKSGLACVMNSTSWDQRDVCANGGPSF